MDGPTITLIIGIVGCVIGISTFVSSLLNKAQTNGVLEQKIEQALQGIEEIKVQVKESSVEQTKMSLNVQSHRDQINVINKDIEDIKSRIRYAESISDILGKILEAIKSLKEDKT